MQKKKVLWVSDVNESTGFGVVAYNLIPKLLKTNRYDMVAMGINYRGGRHGLGDIHVYPCDSRDPYGFGVFPHVVMTEKPDLIFVLQDLFIVFRYFQFLEKNYPEAKTVLYFPVDGNSMPPTWVNAVRYATIPVVYSEYGRRLVFEKIPDVASNLRLIYHGVDYEVFRPFPDDERKNMKASNNVQDKFVIGVVNRFQPRKMIPLIIRAFSLFKNGYKKCATCGNYYYPHLDMCDLNFCTGDHTFVPGHNDCMLYMHMNPEEPMMGGDTNTLEMSMNNANLKDASNCVMFPGVDIYGPAAPNKFQMNAMYNMLDCYIAADCGEGFGLTQMEALSVGLPIIKSNNTTGPELVGKFAYMANSCGFFSMSHDSGHFRPVVSVPSLVDGLEKLYKKWSINKWLELSLDQHNYVRRNFAWDDKAIDFDLLFQEAITKEQVKSIKVVRI